MRELPSQAKQSRKSSQRGLSWNCTSTPILYGARIAAQHNRDAVAYAATIEEHVSAARASGDKTLTAIAAYLNDHAVPSREGKLWHPSSVSRTVRRLREIKRPDSTRSQPCF